MDITHTLAPVSDQMDAVDLQTGPRTFTVKSVTEGSREQPVNVHLVEFPRPWRPSKNMRRVLAAIWGADASQWQGHRITLYLDPDVVYGGIKVGGIRISHASHIDRRTDAIIMPKRGRSEAYSVEPIRDPAPTQPPQPAPVDDSADWITRADQLTDIDALRDLYQQAKKAAAGTALEYIIARVADLKAEEEEEEASR